MAEPSALEIRRQLLVMRAHLERAEWARELTALRQETGLKPTGMFRLLPWVIKAAQLGRSTPSMWQLGRLWRSSPWLGTLAAAALGAGRDKVSQAISRRPWLLVGASALLAWQVWRAWSGLRPPRPSSPAAPPSSSQQTR